MPDPTRTAAPPDLTHSLADGTATTGGETASPTPALPSGAGRYTLGAEIARGGMGVVYRGTDTTLGREVAVKVLLDKYGPGSGTARRFADEARIAAQLQHPGIPPVHDLGTLPDGRPFLAMKLIKGETLDDLLKQRPDPAAERGRFVAAFEQVCHAVAYAHAHGVIHRDLKPANVMVGSFGEVQVMDWGLAKVLVNRGSDAAGDPDATAPPEPTEIRSLRDSDGSETQAGSVLGTPAFMPPEQAVGAVGKIDARSDVFGLGAILAVILTGQPPFTSSSAETTRVKAAQGDVADCFARLDGCGAEPDLVALAKRCLSPKPADRPADAGEVARAVAELRHAADERARQAELDKVKAEGERATAEAQAVERRKRRRIVQWAAAALAVVLTAGVVVSGIGFFRANEQRLLAVAQRDEIADRERQVVAQKAVADKRLEAYRQAVDMFANEAPNIVEGHPLGAAPMEELLQLALRMSAATADELESPTMRRGADMCVFVRQAQFARSQGRTNEAEKHFDKAIKVAEELFHEAKPGRRGTSAGNLALVISQRASMVRMRGEVQAGSGDKQKARESFAEAVKMHEEAIALHRRVFTEPEMRDIHVGEAQLWLAGSYFELAETHRITVHAATDKAGKRAALEAARTTAIQSEEHFAAGLATGWNERMMDRTRMRQAFASWERATAADKLDDLIAGDSASRPDEGRAFRAEADAAFQRSFELFSALVKDVPKNLLIRIHFSKLAVEQGDFLMLKLRDYKRCQVVYAAAVEQAQRLAKPVELSRYADAVGANLYRLGLSTHYLGDKAKARDLFAASVQNREEMLREAIRVYSESSRYTVLARIRLMFSQARFGDHVTAAKNAESVRATYPKELSYLSYVAQVFVICSDVTDDPELKKQYVTKVFETFTMALDQGYSDVALFEHDPDLDPLRSDPRFPKLVERAKVNAYRQSLPREVLPPPRKE